MDRVLVDIVAAGIVRDATTGSYYFHPAEIVRVLGGIDAPGAAVAINTLLTRALDAESAHAAPRHRVPLALEDV